VRFEGKVAVVTGGSRGIGRAVALRLAGEGAAVAVGYRDRKDAADEVVAGIAAADGRAVALQADVGDPAATGALVDRAVEELGRLDILVSNAGIEHFGALEELTPEDFDRVFGVNTRGQLFAVQHAARHLGDGGRIVLMSSVSARRSVFHHTLYSASKAAVETMVLNLAPELGRRGITINAIAPGATTTDMSATAGPHYAHPDLPLDPAVAMRVKTALGRRADPAEIAAAVAFLVSDDAAYLTGRTLSIDGGYF
jgi:3-oxoacyl-[acyl-carrier protein] reductase